MRLNALKIMVIAMLGAIISTTTVEAAIIKKKSDPKAKVDPKKPTPAKPIVVPSKQVVYKKPTPVVKAVHRLPSTAISISKGGVNFHFSNGRYYRYDGGRYISTAPPVGLKIRVLPVGYTVVRLMNRDYYYYEGVYYAQSNREYVVVDAPEEITVKTLPEEAELISYEGKDYYLYNGKIYGIVITPDGKAFQVVGNLDM